MTAGELTAFTGVGNPAGVTVVAISCPACQEERRRGIHYCLPCYRTRVGVKDGGR